MTRRPLAVAVAAGLLLTVTGPAGATSRELPDLPDISAQELADSINELDLQVHDIDVDGSISGLTTETTGGSGSTITLSSDILFGFDEAQPSTPATTAVEEIVADIPRDARVRITGHTDDVGDDAYNRTLSMKRARAVETIVAKARPDLSTTTTGRGSSEPVEPNTRGGEDNPEGRAKNRRVEISWS